mgnify:CR=1 FL=1
MTLSNNTRPATVFNVGDGVECGCVASLFVATEDDAQALQFENVVGSLSTHGLDGILIAEIEPALRSVEGMGFPRIVLSQRRVDAPLRSHRVAANRMDFRHHGDVEIRRCGNRRSHPCQTGSDDKNVV